MIALGLVALACLAQETSGQASGATEDAGSALPPILLSSPGELPRAKAGRWSGYDGTDLQALGVEREIFDVLQRAQTRYLARDYPGALEPLFQALRSEPDLPEALSLAGLVYFRLRRYGDAVLLYERLVEVAPKLVGRTLALGHGYYSLGDYARARAHYLRLKELRPNDPSVQRALGLTLYRLGDEEAALAIFEALLERGAELDKARYWLGRIRYERGEPELALEHVKALDALTPYDVRTWYLRMQVLYDLGREEEARAAESRWREVDLLTQELRKVDGLLGIQPGRFDLLSRKFELHARLGDAFSARAVLPRLVEARPPEVAEAGLYLGTLETLLGLGDTAGALAAARTLEQRCPDDLATWKRLELLYASMRMRTDQVRAARRVRELASPPGETDDGQ